MHYYRPATCNITWSCRICSRECGNFVPFSVIIIIQYTACIPNSYKKFQSTQFHWVTGCMPFELLYNKPEGQRIHCECRFKFSWWRALYEEHHSNFLLNLSNDYSRKVNLYGTRVLFFPFYIPSPSILNTALPCWPSPFIGQCFDMATQDTD